MSGPAGRRVAIALLVLITTVIADPPQARAETISCMDEPTVEELIGCIEAHMPGKSSHGFAIPTQDDQADWRSVVWAMLNGSCENIILPSSLAGAYTVRKFVDRESLLELCVLAEVLDYNEDSKVDRGWGTFITNPRASREVNVLAPHPINDRHTHVQSVSVFKGTRARSVLVAGSHRSANGPGGTCGGYYRVSDPTHSVDTMFQPTMKELIDFYVQTRDEYVVLQFHGMAKTTCQGVDVHLSNGHASVASPDMKLLALRANLLRRQPEWTVTLPGDETISCALDGTTNVQVRLLGGVPYDEVCNRAPERVSSRFIHIEQKRPARTVGDWVSALNETWPTFMVSTEPFEPPAYTEGPPAEQMASAPGEPVGGEGAMALPDNSLAASDGAEPAPEEAGQLQAEAMAAGPLEGDDEPPAPITVAEQGSETGDTEDDGQEEDHSGHLATAGDEAAEAVAAPDEQAGAGATSPDVPAGLATPAVEGPPVEAAAAASEQPAPSPAE